MTLEERLRKIDAAIFFCEGKVEPGMIRLWRMYRKQVEKKRKGKK